MEWYGVVLAGGRSSRMGEDKAGLLWRGERFLDLAMRRLEALVGAERVWASGEGRGEKCVPDRKPGLGPLGGLHAVCERLPGGAGLLVSPVDMPLLQEEELARLRDALSRSGILAAQFEGVPLPMALRVGAQCRAALAA